MTRLQLTSLGEHVARQLNAKFRNPDNSVFQALKVQRTKNREQGDGGRGRMNPKCKLSKCVVEACYVVYFGKRKSAENSIFPHAILSGFYGKASSPLSLIWAVRFAVKRCFGKFKAEYW